MLSGGEHPVNTSSKTRTLEPLCTPTLRPNATSRLVQSRRRITGVSDQALALASKLKNTLVSFDQWPFTSPAQTTRRPRARRATSSRNVLPSRHNATGDTRVVSTANCTPPTTSRRLPSCTWGALRSISRNMKLVATLAPPSRQMRAATLSTANPRRPRTPALEHAARWWPKDSKELREGEGDGGASRRAP